MNRYIIFLLLAFHLQGCSQTVMHPKDTYVFTGPPETVKTDLIAEWNLIPGYGQWAFNRVGGNSINNNVIGFSEQDFNGYANFNSPIGKPQSTITDNFANNRNGLPIAARLVTSSGAGHDIGTGFVPGLRYDFTLPAGTYTISVDVKSNTGSTQTIRMESPLNTFSSNLNVTTSWNRVSFTVTSTGIGQNYIFAENGSGGSALDILFDGVKIEAGGSASGYVTPNFDLFFGNSAITESIDPVWIAGKGISVTNQYASAYSSAGASTTNFTVYTVAKLNSNQVEQSWALSEDYTDNKFSIVWGDSLKGGITPQFYFNNHTVVTKVSDLADNKPHLLTGTYDGNDLKIYIDTILVGTTTSAGLSSIEIRRLMLGGMNLVGNTAFNGEIYYASIYSVAHPQATINLMFDSLKRIMSIRGIKLNGIKKFVMFDGDSISDVPSNGLFPKYAMRTLPPDSRTAGEDVAVIGSRVADLVSRASLVDSYYDPKRSKNVLSIFIGANDLSGVTSVASFFADLKAYCLARKAVGWKIILGTLLPNTNSGFNTKRNAANVLINADPSFYDVLADFASDATMGTDAAASDTGLYVDGVHPTAAGHVILGAIEEAAILSLL